MLRTKDSTFSKVLRILWAIFEIPVITLGILLPGLLLLFLLPPNWNFLCTVIYAALSIIGLIEVGKRIDERKRF